MNVEKLYIAVSFQGWKNIKHIIAYKNHERT